MTDGILLAELQRDRSLRRYDTIIIDEAHERSLNIDFLLGYLRRLLPRAPRPEADHHLGDHRPGAVRRALRRRRGRPAPIVEVSGRTYPVEVRYRPLVELPEQDEEGEAVVRDQTEAIVDAVARAERRGTRATSWSSCPGSGRSATPPTRWGTWPVATPGGQASRSCPLYSRLSAAEQHRVFERHTGRRVVLATNVAETSLTVPGIRYVVDTGVARICRYSARTKVQRLPIEPISQASANQRSGRCGRVEAGHRDPALLRGGLRRAGPEFTDPEILRTNLASVILQMASARAGRRRPVPVRRAARPAQRHAPASSCSRSSAPWAERARAGHPADPARPAAGPAADRPAAGPDDPRGRAARLRARGDRDRRGAVAAGPARAPGRAPGRRPTSSTPASRTSASDFLTWLNLWRYLRSQQRELSLQRVPPDVQARVPQLPAGARVAGLRVPAAAGLPGDEGARSGQPGRHPGQPTASTRPCSPGCSPTSGCSRSGRGQPGAAARASTSAPAAPASRSSPAACCAGRTRSS